MNYEKVQEFLNTNYLKYEFKENQIMTNNLLQEYEKIKGNKRDFLRNYFKNKNYELFQECKNFISKQYYDGYGIKWIAKKLNITYTRCRSILISYFNIDIRKGRSVVTDKVKEFRKEKSILESNNKTGWNSIECREKLKIRNSNQRGVSGYYYNNSLQKYVWLRSTYEFIFAEWLDKNNNVWDVEVTTFKIKNTTYRPDFFIYDYEMNIKKIVEIKGYYDNRAYKVGLLKNELPELEIVLLGATNKTIENYIIENDKKYKDKLKQWKQKRIMNL